MSAVWYWRTRPQSSSGRNSALSKGTGNSFALSSSGNDRFVVSFRQSITRFLIRSDHFTVSWVNCTYRIAESSSSSYKPQGKRNHFVTLARHDQAHGLNFSLMWHRTGRFSSWTNYSHECTTWNIDIFIETSEKVQANVIELVILVAASLYRLLYEPSF